MKPVSDPLPDEPPKLSPEPARTDLTDRECAKLIGGMLGVLLQMADPEQVRRGLLWWLTKPEAWGFLLAAEAEVRRLTGVSPFAVREGGAG